MSRSMSLTSAWKTAGEFERPKGHDQIFKMPGMGVKGGLPFVPLNRTVVQAVRRQSQNGTASPIDVGVMLDQPGVTQHDWRGGRVD